MPPEWKQGKKEEKNCVSVVLTLSTWDHREPSKDHHAPDLPVKLQTWH